MPTLPKRYSTFNGRLPAEKESVFQYCDITLWENGTLIKKYEHRFVNYGYDVPRIDISESDPVLEGCFPKRIEQTSPTEIVLSVEFSNTSYIDVPWEMQIDNFTEEIASE